MGRFCIAACVVLGAAAILVAPALSQEEPLEFRALNPTLSYGSDVRFVGRVVGATGEPVRVFRIDGDREIAETAVLPGTGGRFEARVVARGNRRYVARHAGRVSRVRQILVRARVSLEPPKVSGEHLVLTGRTRPGEGRIRVYRHTHCRGRVVARRRLEGSDGRYRVRIPLRDGRYFVEFLPAAAGVYEDRSRVRQVGRPARVTCEVFPGGPD